MILVATMGLGSAAYGELTSHAVQREKEADLLFVGDQYREAIAAYYQRTPGAVKRYPRKLEDLLEDNRYPMTVRHLRRLYADPITGDDQWGILTAPDGGIMGVYSLSTETPIKSGGFSYKSAGFHGAQSYTEWKFAYFGDSPVGLPRRN